MKGGAAVSLLIFSKKHLHLEIQLVYSFHSMKRLAQCITSLYRVWVSILKNVAVCFSLFQEVPSPKPHKYIQYMRLSPSLFKKSKWLKLRKHGGPIFMQLKTKNYHKSLATVPVMGEDVLFW
jgi:hypothetical protein